MEIGAILKEAREEKNISLDSLQESTKIQKRYLKAIEQGNFHILPGTFYARAFIKEYAEAVGLNADELLAMHQNELPTSQPKSEVQYTRMQRSRRDNQSNKSPVILSIIPKIIVVLLIIGVIFLTITLYKKAVETDDDHPVENNDNEIIRNKEQNGGTTNNDPSGSDDNNTDDKLNDSSDDTNDIEGKNEADQSKSELSTIEIGTGAKPESTYELTDAGDEILIVFEPTGVTWLDVINEQNEYLFQGMTEPDKRIEVDVSGQERFRINIGSAPNLPVIYINDIEFKYPVDPNQFVTQRIWIQVIKANSGE